MPGVPQERTREITMREGVDFFSGIVIEPSGFVSGIGEGEEL